MINILALMFYLFPSFWTFIHFLVCWFGVRIKKKKRKLNFWVEFFYFIWCNLLLESLHLYVQRWLTSLIIKRLDKLKKAQITIIRVFITFLKWRVGHWRHQICLDCLPCASENVIFGLTFCCLAKTLIYSSWM